jgi:hypothetical protein
VLQRRLHGPGGGACAAPRGGAGGPATREGRRRGRAGGGREGSRSVPRFAVFRVAAASSSTRLA